jgi:hypothetical protein
MWACFRHRIEMCAHLRRCKTLGVKGHPARFPKKLPDFFIKFLTESNDFVLDIFASSNTTGEAAEDNQRKWISFEIQREYAAASSFRFIDFGEKSQLKSFYNKLLDPEILKEILEILNDPHNKIDLTSTGSQRRLSAPVQNWFVKKAGKRNSLYF